jgi:hypothetical protein
VTGLQELPLGTAPATGGDAIGQYRHFKLLLRNEIGSVDGAWIEHRPAGGKVNVVAMYDPGVQGAAEHAKRASEWAPNIWERVTEKRERVRG